MSVPHSTLYRHYTVIPNLVEALHRYSKPFLYASLDSSVSHRAAPHALGHGCDEVTWTRRSQIVSGRVHRLCMSLSCFDLLFIIYLFFSWLYIVYSSDRVLCNAALLCVCVRPPDITWAEASHVQSICFFHHCMFSSCVIVSRDSLLLLLVFIHTFFSNFFFTFIFHAYYFYCDSSDAARPYICVFGVICIYLLLIHISNEWTLRCYV